MKTIKNYIWMVAATMMVAALGACSNEDLAVEGTSVQQSKVVTLTATLSQQNGAETRSTMADNGTNIVTAWEVGDKIWVNYDDTGSNNLVAKGTVTAVDGDGKATVTVDLVNPKNASTIVFGFPYDHWTEAKDVRVDQLGTLDDINRNHGAISGSGTLTVVGSDVTLPTSVNMSQDLCIWKLNFKDGGSDITNQITSLNISFGAGDDYMITPNAQNNIYVALYPVDGGNITITAATATGIYSYTKSGVTLNTGKIYRSTVAMSAAAASSTYRVFTSRTNYSDVAIPDGATTVTSGTTAWAAGTYVVSGDVTITGDITLSGDVNLILKDGAELTVNGCIFGGVDYDHGFVHKLNIYGQSLGTGKLTVDYSGTHELGVVTASELNIHGGIITVGGSTVVQGMEPANFNVYHGTVNASGAVNGIIPMGNTHIYGGNITAISTSGYGPALSLPNGGKTLTISGGIVTATNNGSNTGIEVVHALIISGGTVYADGQNGGINVYGNSDVTCTISGGNVIATSNGGPGINVSNYSTNDSQLTISGGTITAHGGDGCAAGISAEIISISGNTTEIHATGGENMEGIIAYSTTTTSTISGGTVTAVGGGEGGIGLGGIFTISGGNVTAIGGDGVASSMENGANGFDGTLTMTGGNLKATGGAKANEGSDGQGISENSTIDLTGVTMYEGDSANPSAEAASQTACTKRYVIIK